MEVGGGRFSLCSGILMKSFYLLYAGVTFLSSFLLFQVQPLISKHILAWYGGSSAVWVTAMLFFMVALAVGYVYVLLLSYLRPLYQVVVHGLITIAALASLWTHARVWPSAITPAHGDLHVVWSDPMLAVCMTLLITIGLPFALLSSTSSLMQLWYTNSTGKEPFSLYSVSNVGSLLGLLSYPIVFEPLFSTYTQGMFWGYGFFLYVVLLVGILILVLRNNQSTLHTVTVASEVDTDIPNKRLFLTWLLVASVPVTVLLAGTSFMTVSIAPVPFLWVGPLALYLLSFIISFKAGRHTPKWFNQAFVVITSFLTLILVLLGEAGVALTILVTHLSLFSISHWCHEYLYQVRPNPKHLTQFYVALSLGGISGSVVIKLSASYLLVLPIELMILLVGSSLVITYMWCMSPERVFPNIHIAYIRGIALVVMLVMVVSSSLHVYMKQRTIIAEERNFFGYKAVVDHTDKAVPFWSMQHGLTNHGYQVIEAGVPLIKPVSYYGASSGVAQAFGYIRSTSNESPHVVVAGLGSGGLAAYCLPGDNFTFIEIDTEVVSLAQKYFTYLDACKEHTIVVGDARLVLESEQQNKSVSYDLIILDAYADDMMPVHLLTTEAIALYSSLLTEEGIIAVHISSRYLNLLPVLKALVSDNALFAKHLLDRSPAEKTSSPSEWVLITKNKTVLEHEVFSEMKPISDDIKEIVWTDTYSALLPIVRF
jgi:16S rRNA G966 N2-methylase RsmD